jgi:hypothetical protein
MDSHSLRARFAELFKIAADTAINLPSEPNPALDEIKALAADHYEDLHFSSAADCFKGLGPKLEGQLSCHAWCSAELEISGWKLLVSFKPFCLSNDCAHIQIRHRGAMRNFSVTGYKSMFVPMATFANQTPLEFLEKAIPKAPISLQMELF